MGQLIAGSRGPSPQDESRDRSDSPSATVTSRLLNLAMELGFPLRARPEASQQTMPNMQEPRGEEWHDRASTLPWATSATEGQFAQEGDMMLTQMRPKCSCWTHKTVCLVRELRRFRPVKEGKEAVLGEHDCDCGRICPVHAKIAETTFVDNIALLSTNDDLEKTLDEKPPFLFDDTEYCDAETLRLDEVIPSAGLKSPNVEVDQKRDLTASDEDLRPEQGYLRIILNFGRPINVVAGTRPPSILDVIQHKIKASTGLDTDSIDQRMLTSFYLPRGTVKIIHIARDTTAQDVIAALLRKFRVVDNPRKFALYERQLEEGIESSRVRMRRMGDEELPLSLPPEKQIVLQENDTQDVQWDAFTVPELNNFLVILDREEHSYRRRVKMRYRMHQLKILERMEYLRPGSTTEKYSYITEDLKAASS
ncbi:unnamed protein product [Notodromas monacha]|uniref:Uncharacterized protein n=1 Tax=Notodromas monacha TaxID=399045 RepID=A0A7R9GDN8_9CRUS|nr:unnamed protein product [Notodromas monacha]CAG0918729.1 unnamed protein product [Notodromas monacha]